MTLPDRGMILVDKPENLTSFQALAGLKKILRIKKLGHAGTLDKFAAGLLIVLFGKYTRLIPLFTALDKKYLACFCLGSETDTLDPEGKMVKTGPIPPLDEITTVAAGLVGPQNQVPPDFSAVHVGGRRAYKLALHNEPFQLAPRLVNIFSLEVNGGASASEVELRIHCSKGTYIRALARDLGAQLGTCAYVTRLWRTAIGPFTRERAVSPQKFEPERDVLRFKDFANALPGLAIRSIKSEYEPVILSGSRIREDFFNEPRPVSPTTAVVGQNGEILALLSCRDGIYSYQCVLG